MDFASALMLVDLAKGIIAGIINQVVLAQQKGEVTPEQLAEIKARANVTDAEWDGIVAAAQARLAAAAVTSPGGA